MYFFPSAYQGVFSLSPLKPHSQRSFSFIPCLSICSSLNLRLPPPFCPLAVAIISHNHFRDLLLNNINWDELRHQHVEVPQAYSAWFRKTFCTLLCFTFYLCQRKMGSKIKLQYGFLFGYTYSCKEHEQCSDSFKSQYVSSFHPSMQNKIGFGTFYYFLQVDCMSIPLSPSPSHSNCIFCLRFNSQLSSSYKRSRDAPLWDLGTKRTQDNTPSGLKITISYISQTYRLSKFYNPAVSNPFPLIAVISPLLMQRWKI